MKNISLLFGLAICLSGCKTYQSIPLPSRCEDANVLVRIATEDAGKRVVAIWQLRQMAQDHPMDSEIIMPLFNLEPRHGAFDAVADPDIARILAAGGAPIDELVLKEFNEERPRIRSSIALALAIQPVPDVTRALVEMADSERESPAKRRLCRLILAARGEKSRDWMALVVADVRAVPDDANRKDVDAYEDFLEDLGYAVCKLPRTPALPEALFTRVLQYNGKPTEGAALNALISLATCGADVRPVTDSAQFKDWLAEQPGDGKPGGFMPHMVRACLGIDTRAEMKKALYQLGVYSINSDKVPGCFVFFAPWLGSKDVRAAIHQGLSSSNVATRHGALFMLVALGPDAREMLPEIQESLFDKDPEFRELARGVFKGVAGLDATGQWCVETNPQYRQLMRESSAKQ